MSQADTLPEVRLPAQPQSLLAGVLSYLVPGLGQIYQGRVSKGLLFLVCLYALFFYGQYLGDWQNVYVHYTPQAAGRGGIVGLVTQRARFIGQVWIGAAAWPAVWQYATFNPNEDAHPVLGTFQRMPDEPELNDVLRDNDKSPDLGWVYTVIAGVLNILVIYDAFAGPAVGPAQPRRGRPEGDTGEESR